VFQVQPARYSASVMLNSIKLPLLEEVTVHDPLLQLDFESKLVLVHPNLHFLQQKTHI